MRDAEPDSTFRRINVNCHHVVRGIEEEQLSAVSTPSRANSPVSGDLPLGTSAWEGRYVNLHVAGFVVLMSHPLSIRCHGSAGVIKRSLHDGKWFAVADQGKNPEIVARLGTSQGSTIYPSSAHVHDCGLGSRDDSAMWQYAKHNGFAIVSKDSDLQERSILLGHPPKLIWMRVGTAPARKSRNSCAWRSPSSAFFKRTKNRAWCLDFGPKLNRLHFPRTIIGS